MNNVTAGTRNGLPRALGLLALALIVWAVDTADAVPKPHFQKHVHYTDTHHLRHTDGAVGNSDVVLMRAGQPAPTRRDYPQAHKNSDTKTLLTPKGLPAAKSIQTHKAAPAQPPPPPPSPPTSPASTRRDQTKRKKTPAPASSTAAPVRRIQVAKGTWEESPASPIRPPLLQIFDDDILSRRRMFPHKRSVSAEKTGSESVHQRRVIPVASGFLKHNLDTIPMASTFLKQEVDSIPSFGTAFLGDATDDLSSVI